MGIRGAFSCPKLICRRWKVTWSELQKSAPYNTDGIRWQLGQRVLSGAGRQVRERNYKGLSKSRVKGGGNERANGRPDICINPSLSLCVLCNDNRLMRVSWCRSLMVRRPRLLMLYGAGHTRLTAHDWWFISVCTLPLLQIRDVVNSGFDLQYSGDESIFVPFKRN